MRSRIRVIESLHRRSAVLFAGAAAATAIVLGAGPSFAAGTWSVVPAPPAAANAALAGVATVSDTDAWAVGARNGAANTNTGAQALIDHWDGTAWSQVTTPVTPQNTALLSAVSASGAADAWAVGRDQTNRSNLQGLALHWNGTAWSVSTGFAGALNAYANVDVADISPTDAYATGNNNSIPRGHLAHWNGTAWSAVTVPLPPNAPTNTTLDAVAADGPNDVWAVGTYLNSVTEVFDAFAIHFDGTAWSVAPAPVSGGTLYGLHANGPSDVWAVGGEGNATLVEHFNGTAWSVVPSPSPGPTAILGGVTAAAANDVWAVGSFTPAGATTPQTLTLHWNGTAWSVVPSPDPASSSRLGAVATRPGASTVWAVGETGQSGTSNPLVLRTG
jgi:hypothetical protein